MKSFKGKTTSSQLQKAVKEIQKEGGEVNGNAFEINGVVGFIKFDKPINEKIIELTITITDKPWLASWSMIEEKLKDFFG